MSAARHPNGATLHTDWIDVSQRPGWAGGDVAAYRIWMMWDGFMWWQAHEWQHKDGAEIREGWIRAPQIEPHSGFTVAA